MAIDDHLVQIPEIDYIQAVEKLYERRKIGRNRSAATGVNI